MIGVSNITNRTDPNSLKSRVFVGNLNTVSMPRTEVEAAFAKYGPIIGISIHKGYAFVQYVNEVVARAAVAGEDGNSYYGMKLDVTIASEPKNRKRGRSNPAQPLCPGLMDLALQVRTMAAVGGQLSNLALPVNTQTPALSPNVPASASIMGQPSNVQLGLPTTSVSSLPSCVRQPPCVPPNIQHISRPATQPLILPLNTIATGGLSAAKRTRLEPATSSSKSQLTTHIALSSSQSIRALGHSLSPTTITQRVSSTRLISSEKRLIEKDSCKRPIVTPHENSKSRRNISSRKR